MDASGSAQTTADALERILSLKQAGCDFAVATVVARKAPVSSQLGDRAIIFADGRFEGFIGGACSREVVRKQALEAIAYGQGRLVRLTRDPVPIPNDIPNNIPDEVLVPMSCASEGAIDIYIELYVSRTPLLVVGASPVATALVRQGQGLGYEVTLVCDPAESPAVAEEVRVVALEGLTNHLAQLSAARRRKLVAVVASLGHYDEEALTQLIPVSPGYLGLVASRKRAKTVFALLAEMQLATLQVKSPAGLDIGAKTANEVALSILAEVVQQRRQGTRKADVDEVLEVASEIPSETTVAQATDPICGMSVEVASARHSAEVEGVTYYFCCPNCKARFLRQHALPLAQAS